MRALSAVSFAFLAGCKTAAPAPADAAADANADVAVDIAADVSPQGWHATQKASNGVSLFYSQGIARLPARPSDGFGGGWAFSAKAGLWRTDDSFTQLVEVISPLPSDLGKKFGHIGDIDAVGGVLYAGLEQDDFNANQQAVATFDPQTLAYQGITYLPQHENPCLCIDETTLTAFTPDHYHGQEIRRYDVKNAWKPLDSLTLSRKLDAMQGVDAANGALWFSCDDSVHGLYRADLQTGETVQIGSIGRFNDAGKVQPEVEGIDATQTASGFLHTLTNEPLKVTSWVDDWGVTGQ